MSSVTKAAVSALGARHCSVRCAPPMGVAVRLHYLILYWDTGSSQRPKRFLSASIRLLTRRLLSRSRRWYWRLPALVILCHVGSRRAPHMNWLLPSSQLRTDSALPLGRFRWRLVEGY